MYIIIILLHARIIMCSEIVDDMQSEQADEPADENGKI